MKTLQTHFFLLILPKIFNSFILGNCSNDCPWNKHLLILPSSFYKGSYARI